MAPRFERRFWLIAGLVVGGPLLILGFATGVLSRGSCQEFPVQTWPADEDALTTWLRDQPGVVPHTIRIERAEGSQRTVRIAFTQSGTMLAMPPWPDLASALPGLGYHLLDEAARPCSDSVPGQNASGAPER